MFQKPAFGANTSGFGMQSTFGAATSSAASPFGGFKTATGTSAFGAPPAFGANTSAQPTTGGGLFGSSNTSGGLFGGSTTTAAPAFGATNTGFGFGANTSANTGLFANNASSGLFGNNQTSNAFGAKPAGFGFGSTTPSTNQSTGLFGNTSGTSTGLFGGQTSTLGGGGLFSNTSGGFGATQQPTGTAHVKYNPHVGTDVIVKSGTSQNVNIKHHCITCMKEYESKSLEELRLEDYQAGRKGNRGGMFPFQQPQQENKPLFGGTSFGQPATTSAPSVFGGGGLTGGSTFGQTSTFSFGNNAQTNTNTTGLFGANKPAFGATTGTGTGLFGAPASTQAPAFGTSTSTFGFGSNLQNQTSGGGLFGAKPAASVFGSTANTGFGSFGSGGLFGAKPLQTQAPTFGAPQPGIGTQALGFGTNTSTSGGLFGNTAFGKPATSQPSFGFGSSQPTLGVGLGNTFGQNKPATTGFGQLGTSTMFQNPNANTSFRTGLDSGLGGGMFGNTSGLGGTSLGFGMNANNSAIANLSGASAAGNVHEQILTLAARPYGDSPLFKDLIPDSSTTAEDVLKPTNPAAMKAVLDRSQSAYRVTSPTGIRLKLHPRTALVTDKKSLFDGLEESDASLEDKLTLKPSRKRLVLRPNQRNSDTNNDSGDIVHDNVSYRSQEEIQPRDMNGSAPTGKENSIEYADNAERVKKNISFPDHNNLELSSDRQGSWLNSSKLQWNEKEKPAENEPTPRIYPSLDKELPSDGPERRASWLTTKPLRKPPLTMDSAENSVRELGLRPAAPSQVSLAPSPRDTGNGDILPVTEDAMPPQREVPPHPTGIKLTKAGYYTVPTLDELIPFIEADGSCVIPHFTIGRKNYGNVHYDSEINVAGLDLDNLVHFLNKEIIVYPEDGDKPPVGQGLNRRAVVTLDRVWPRDKTDNRPITDPERLWEFESKLRRVCDKHETSFIEYRPQTGSWVFRVEHFSKYGWTDSDDEEDITPEVMKRQLANQALQKSAATGVQLPQLGKPAVSSNITGPGLGGLGPTSGDSIFAMQQVSMNLLNGASRGFEMDTTEDNTESQSLYQEKRAFGVKSPTSELARLEHRQSHHVQLMKASLYVYGDVDDDMSTSTGDQLVPMSGPALSTAETVSTVPGSGHRDNKDFVDDDASVIVADELQMKPLIVRPHTIVLNYHRKVPPFKNTIAGRLDAAYIGDMAISMARHSRVGFGVNGALAFPTSYDCLANLSKDAKLSDIDKYLKGREDNDWSEPIVARMAIQQTDNNYNILEIVGRQLDTLFKHSEFVSCSGEHSPRLRMLQSARERRAAHRQLLANAALTRDNRQRYGVSGAYCYEVWQLCEALWGLDLENDGIPGTDDASIVNRHKKFVEWMKASVADITEHELSKPTRGESEDEDDGHSARIWTLLLGGRILEACKVAKENGDLNMATLIAQAAGDPIFRSLIARQLYQWRECGADSHISTYRRGALQLLAGEPPLQLLAPVDWKLALHATARYLCPQVPTLEQIIRKYESFFTSADVSEPVQLSTLDDDETAMQYPLPPYTAECDVVISHSTKTRRMLDLRYELIRARAFNTQPKLRPESYTRDPLDYTLCFIVSTWLGQVSGELATGTAEKLEAAGGWELAILALCYHPDDAVRSHLIRNILSRHAPAKVDTPESKAKLELMKTLRIPDKWVLLAQAHRAKYEHLPSLEAEYLVGAEQWNAAHKVLLDELLPDAVLADNLQSIASLLDKMNEAAERHELSGWSNGGQALHHYLHVCDEIRGLVSSAKERSVVQSKLEALRPTVIAACKALQRLSVSTSRDAAARAEMGARLVQLAVAAGEPPHHLASLLATLKLPPDCTLTALLKITTDLAEQASELCIESVSSSPMSSQHRATALS